MSQLLTNNASALLAAGNPLTVDPDLAIFSAILFSILLAILWKFAWGPISDGLEKREKSIADQIDSANAAAEKSARLLADHEAKMATASDEANQILATARKEAEVVKERIVSQANEEAERQRQRAISDIEAAKNQAVRALAQASVDSAVALAGRLVGEELDAQRHAKLIENSLDQFQSSNN